MAAEAHIEIWLCGSAAVSPLSTLLATKCSENWVPRIADVGAQIRRLPHQILDIMIAYKDYITIYRYAFYLLSRPNIAIFIDLVLNITIITILVYYLASYIMKAREQRSKRPKSYND